MKLVSSRFLPYSRQEIAENDVDAVLEVLRSDLITQGPQIEQFEQKFARTVGAKFAVACNSGTAALHLACRTLGLNNRGSILTSPITFLASATCAEFMNAQVEFGDIEQDTWGISVDLIKKTLERKKVDIVIPVHFAGHSVDMSELSKLRNKYGFKIVEDACHALGGEYGGKQIGSCQFSDIATFSFHPVKHITTGEGGMLTTNSAAVYEKAVELRAHGVHKDPKRFVNEYLAFDEEGQQNPWYYEMRDLGYNYRMTGLQAALGLSQLDKLDDFIKRRRYIASRYNKELARIEGVTLPVEKTKVKHGYHLYTLLIDFDLIGKSRRQVMEELRERNVGTQVLYIPVHLQPYFYEKYGHRPGEYPIAENYYSKCLSIPIFPSMTDDEIEVVIASVCDVLAK